jgi:hypothetical protein
MRCILLETLLENLGPDDYDQDRISPRTVHLPLREKHNCIALAAGENDKWWWPSKRFESSYYWPDHLPREESLKETLPNFIRAFATKGYKVCKSAKLERGVEKVAIYVGPLGNPTHAARQLESGLWLSKCGDLEDIEHKSLAALEGKVYGNAVAFLKRKRDTMSFLVD